MDADKTPKKPPAEKLLTGWLRLNHITPRRPGSKKTDKRPRLTWGMTYQDPDRAPHEKPVTQSTGERTQAAALRIARERDKQLERLSANIQDGSYVPKYLRIAQVSPKVGRLKITDAAGQVSNSRVSDQRARHIYDYGMHFAAYAAKLGVQYLDEITEDLLRGWTRTVILEPCEDGNVKGEYARSLGREWPIRPDWVGPGDPPESVYVRYYTIGLSRERAGGTGAVLPIDATCLRFATEPQTLTDGTVYFHDLLLDALEFEQLTPIGQLTVRPPLPSWML